GGEGAPRGQGSGRGGGAALRRFVLARREDGRIEDVGVAVRPVPAKPIKPVPPFLATQHTVYDAYPIGHRIIGPEPQPGPVIGGASVWEDRADGSKHWYM